MEQGILVVYMPKRCADCKLNCSIGGEQPFCYVNLEKDICTRKAYVII